MTQQEFIENLDDIINDIDDTTSTVWVIDHKVVLIPYPLFDLFKSTVNLNELQGELQSSNH